MADQVAFLRRDRARRLLGQGAAVSSTGIPATRASLTISSLALGRDKLAEALQCAGLHVDAARSEDGAVEIRSPRVRCIVVERLPLVVQRSERRFVLRERPSPRRRAAMPP